MRHQVPGLHWLQSNSRHRLLWSVLNRLLLHLCLLRSLLLWTRSLTSQPLEVEGEEEEVVAVAAPAAASLQMREQPVHLLLHQMQVLHQ